MLRPLTLIACLLAVLPLACPAWAGDQPAPLAEGEDFYVATAKMLAGLALVLAVMVGTYWLARRFLPGQAGGGTGRMKLLGRLGLGPRKYLALVEVAGEVLVLGVSNDAVRLLRLIDDPAKVDALKKSGAPAFAKALKRAKAGVEEEP